MTFKLFYYRNIKCFYRLNKFNNGEILIMGVIIRKKFSADYWRENYDVLLNVVENEDYDSFKKIKKISRRVNRKNESDLKDENLIRDLHELTKGLSQDCWNKFLKKVNDKKYELTRKRISLTEEAYDYLQNMIEEFNFKDASEFISFATDVIPDKRLMKFKSERQKENE